MIMKDESPAVGDRGPSRILIVDDHPLFRGALRRVLREEPDLEILGESENGLEALEMCQRLGPDLVLMDVSMPKMDGLEATYAIKREFPQTVVLVMTASEEPNHLAKALRAGAAGYVLKTAPPQQIIDAICGALNGETPLNQEVAVRLLLRLMDEVQEERFSDIAPGGPPAGKERPESPLPSSLTSREAEVLRLVARGQTNQQIAENLLVSVSTIKKHLRHIIDKLDVSDRTQAAVRAIELGLRHERGG